MIEIGNRRLNADDFFRVLYEGAPLEADPAALRSMEANHAFLKEYAVDKVIYGINTGFGPMAQYRISAEEQRALQYNLIRSHSAGSGSHFPEILARATMLARLNGLMKGYSGVHVSTAKLMIQLLNRQISPCIFEHGGVGASGDLVQLAHLALNLIGEGEVWHQGRLQDCARLFAAEGIRPLEIHLREGLALLNGTSAMTGIGLVNLIHARKLLSLSLAMSAMTNELMCSFDDHFSQALNAVKQHSGQQVIAGGMRDFLQGSRLIRKRPDHLYERKVEEDIFSDKVQEYYSLRCVPQILGPVYDSLQYSARVLEDELNSVNDNPVIDHLAQDVFHGGNFHGDYVSLEMDKLKTVVTRMAMLSERQLNYLLNDKLNQKLPPFINLGKLGLNFGLQGLQFAATSTTAENQTLSYPMYLHSIPNNNDNQDIVSMGCNAALIAKKVIDNSFEVMSVQAIALAQAVDHLDCLDRMAPASRAFYEQVRQWVPALREDRAPYKDLVALKDSLFHIPYSISF